MVLAGTMCESDYRTLSLRERKPCRSRNNLVAAFLVSCGLCFDVAQGSTLQDLDLDRPVRDLRLPLIPAASGAAAGLITAREIRLEAQSLGPFRVRNLAGPVIEDLSVQLPNPAETSDNTWAGGLAQFLVVGRHPVPAVINNLKIKGVDSRDVLHARRATFDAPKSRLELQRATIVDADGALHRLPRVWLLLGGEQAGSLVWRAGDENDVATRHLLDPAAQPDD